MLDRYAQITLVVGGYDENLLPIRSMLVSFATSLFLMFYFLTVAHSAPERQNVDPVIQVIKISNELWRPNAPFCSDSKGRKFPSKLKSGGECEDGDSVIFNGLLCASGEEIGCQAVLNSQDEASFLPRRGEWWRSPRIATDDSLKSVNSFSNDQNIGVLLTISAKKNDPMVITKLSNWTTWIEANAACVLGNEPLCLRGWPRYCRDDTEKGCMLRPGDIGTFATFLHRVNLPLPNGPDGFMRQLFTPFVEAAIPFSFSNSQLNSLGYPLHLVGAEVLLWRSFGTSEETDPLLNQISTILSRRQPKNPFFGFLANQPKPEVARKVLSLCPTKVEEISLDKTQWTWERADDSGAEKSSMLWDCIFMANLLSRP